jgi:hypothetical protein
MDIDVTLSELTVVIGVELRKIPAQAFQMMIPRRPTDGQ